MAAKVQGKYDIRNFQSEISGVIRKEQDRKDRHFRGQHEKQALQPGFSPGSQCLNIGTKSLQQGLY
ncbi:hypothetical protein [Segatella maculosa]|uniref:hypothetical protein n=1 Tax=Segatella maculosa TaxID=439703 RepID=UPI0002E3701F|nr:hypothetical protein [Segatella maculosa]